MRGNLRVLLFFTRCLYARPLRVAFMRGQRPRPGKNIYTIKYSINL